MKVVALIPIWLQYHHDIDDHDSREVLKLGGRYLINYSLEVLNTCSAIDDIVIYSSNEDILDYIEPDQRFTYVERPEHLDSINTPIENVIEAFLHQVDADIVVFVHPNSPFLKQSTVDKCIEEVRCGNHRCAFTAMLFRQFAWLDGEPLNYSLSSNEVTPHPSTIKPVIIEQASLYVFSKKLFLETRRRTDKNPYIHFLDHFEGHEVRFREDMEIAKLIIDSGFQGVASR
jgi:CMP-N-acetylneuraminic acid synthetase